MNLIKQARTAKNLTQQELSIKSNVPLSSIKQYETGKRNPKIEQLQKIAEALDVPLTDILFEKLEPLFIDESEDKDPYIDLGTRIKQARNEKKITQSDLAKKIGVSRIAIGNYERGERQPTIEILEAIASALNIGIYTLLEPNSNLYNQTQNSKLAKKIALLDSSSFTELSLISADLKTIIDFLEYINGDISPRNILEKKKLLQEYSQLINSITSIINLSYSADCDKAQNLLYSLNQYTNYIKNELASI